MGKSRQGHFPLRTLTTTIPIGGFIGDTCRGRKQHTARQQPAQARNDKNLLEIGVELRFFNNRLKLDYAYYTNDSNNPDTGAAYIKAHRLYQELCSTPATYSTKVWNLQSAECPYRQKTGRGKHLSTWPEIADASRTSLPDSDPLYPHGCSVRKRKGRIVQQRHIHGTSRAQNGHASLKA